MCPDIRFFTHYFLTLIPCGYRKCHPRALCLNLTMSLKPISTRLSSVPTKVTLRFRAGKISLRKIQLSSRDGTYGLFRRVNLIALSQFFRQSLLPVCNWILLGLVSIKLPADTCDGGRQPQAARRGTRRVAGGTSCFDANCWQDATRSK